MDDGGGPEARSEEEGGKSITPYAKSRIPKQTRWESQSEDFWVLLYVLVFSRTVDTVQIRAEGRAWSTCTLTPSRDFSGTIGAPTIEQAC